MKIITAPRLLLAAVLAVTGVVMTAGPVAAAPSGCAANPVKSFTPPPDPSGPFGISRGPGGMWYADGDHLVQIRQGRQRTFNLPGHADAGWLAQPAHSSILWFGDRAQGRIGTIDAYGYIEEYQIPNGVNGAALPNSYVFGPGRAVWFTDAPNNRIGRLDLTTGHFTFYKNVGIVAPIGMARGRDGALYFANSSVDTIGRLAPDGTWHFWHLTAGSFPVSVLVGPDGNVWFTELNGNKLGRIDAAWKLTEYPVTGGPVGMTLGPDGHMYLGLWLAKQVARVGTDGIVQRTWSVPGALLVGAGRGDTVWATDHFDTHSVTRVRIDCPD